MVRSVSPSPESHVVLVDEEYIPAGQASVGQLMQVLLMQQDQGRRRGRGQAARVVVVVALVLVLLSSLYKCGWVM